MSSKARSRVKPEVVALASFRRGDRLNLPFMAHRSRPFAVIALLFAAACTDPLTSADLLGEWGGEHIGLMVIAAGATLEYDCASGTIDEPLNPDASGRFEARGTFVPGKGGPAIEGEEPLGYPALHQGTTDGETMTLRVTRLDTGESLGTFVLALGAPPRVFRCL